MPAVNRILPALWVASALLLAGCNGHDDRGGAQPQAPAPTASAPAPAPAPALAPAGLSYDTALAIYSLGQAIVPNAPHQSGGAVQRYAVVPDLPAGLGIDAATGVISGTPSAVAAAADYVVTAANDVGTATARLRIEVRQTLAAPSGLAYREADASYTVGQAIAANTPSSTGGQVAGYAVSPALPDGLSLDPASGAIAGTPTGVSAAADFTVVASNASGTASATVRIAVQAALAPPARLVYDFGGPVLARGAAMSTLRPQAAGGAVDSFSITPALPSGVSLNSRTGEISGTPAVTQPATGYTVVATNAAGSAQAQVRITVVEHDTWVVAGQRPAGTFLPTLVRLLNGKVMAVGEGDGHEAPSTRAQLYDPGTDSWSDAAAMTTPRLLHGTTVLPDGRVLVAGGIPAAAMMSTSAELYDPVADTWTPTGSLSVGRAWHGQGLLPGGKVLVLGGLVDITTNGYVLIDGAESYDPATGTWTPLPLRLSTPRYGFVPQLDLNGDSVLVPAGLDINGSYPYAQLLALDGSSTRMSSILPGFTTTYTVESVRLNDGRVLMSTPWGPSSWIVDPADSNGMAPAAIPMATNHGSQAPVLLKDGRVLLGGGSGLALSEVFDPQSNRWTTVSPQPVPTDTPRAVLLPDGSVLTTDWNGTTLRYVP